MNSQTPNQVPGCNPDQGQESGPEALLSAYLDGELTAAETEAVEAHLESSEESRRVLDELRSLSSYLTDLTPESAPESLRSSLLASHSKPQPTTRSLRGPLIAAVVTVAALLMVAVIPQLSPWSGSSSHLDDASPAVLAETTAAPEAAPSAELVANAGLGDFADGTTIADGGELVFDKTPGKAEVGQILSAIDTSDGQAVVVRLTVVDIEQGLDSLRLLLQRHQIAAADIVDEAAHRSATRRRQGAKSPSGGGQLVSVVVRASSEQVSEAMASLRREVASEMELTGVLHLAALQTAPGGRRALEQLQSYGGKPSRSQAGRSARDDSKSSPAGNDREPTAVAPGAARTKQALASAQVRLDLPAGLLRQVSRARTGSQPSTTTAEQGKRQLQVVFVLVSTSRPASPPRSEPDGAA